MNKEYENWLNEPTPENMYGVLKSVEPLVIAEASKYSGPKNLLQSRAKKLAVDAIKTYDPTKNTALNTWVVSNLRPLSRYANHLQPVRLPEETNRRVKEVMRIRQEWSDQHGREPSHIELADHIGVSVPKIKSYINKAVKLRTEGMYDEMGEEDSAISPAVSTIRKLPDIEHAVYEELDTRDKFIFDHKTGRKTGKQLSNAEIAKRLNVSPAYVSQRSQLIAERIKRLST